MSSVQKKGTRSKKAARDRRILSRARREERPVSAGIKRAAARSKLRNAGKPEDLVTLKRSQIEQAVRVLAIAQHAAIEGAMSAQHLGAGPPRAIDAYRHIEYVRKELHAAIGGAT